MKSFYETNEGFKHYVDGYCRKHEVSPDIAFTHRNVIDAYEYYKDAESKKISVSELKAGCSGAVAGGDCK